MEKKDWNQNQSGGNHESPFYNKINKVLRCHYFVTFTNVEESAVAVTANTFTALAKTSTSTSTSSSPKGSATSSDVANHEKTLDNVQKEQRQHKKRQNTAAKHEDSAIASTMEGVKSKGINWWRCWRGCRNLKWSKLKWYCSLWVQWWRPWKILKIKWLYSKPVGSFYGF